MTWRCEFIDPPAGRVILFGKSEEQLQEASETILNLVAVRRRSIGKGEEI